MDIFLKEFVRTLLIAVSYHGRERKRRVGDETPGKSLEPRFSR